MKKKMTLAFIVAVAGATSMTLTSCSDEIPAPSAAVSGEDVYMTFTTSLPSGISTYAANDAHHSSLEGGLKNLEGSIYYVRYIMEIYKYDDSADNKCGERVERQIKYKPLTADVDYRHLDFTGVRLKNDTKYITLFWSDIVRKHNSEPDSYKSENEGKTFVIDGVEYDNLTSLDGLNTTEYYESPYFLSNPEEFYTNPEGEDSGKVLYSGLDNYHITDDADVKTFFVPSDIRTVYASDYGDILHQEMYDGYYAKEILDLTTDESKNHFITLKRPFAKLRVVITDANRISEIAGLVSDDGFQFLTVELRGTYIMKVPSEGTNLFDEVKPVFNLITGEAETHKIFSKAPGYWSVKNRQFYTYGSEASENSEKTMCAYYIPGNQAQAYNWTYAWRIVGYVEDADGRYLTWGTRPDFTVYSVPLVTNKVTTIKGSFLSSSYGEGDISISIDDGLEEYTPEYGSVNF